MSQTIHPLSEECINQIAAGEVIERPASVVKELVENALDAGATQIDIRLLQGGISRIEISDNGKGMSKGDLEICYFRYTTSKLQNPEQIFSIQTSGFRGEALSSISAVAQVEIITKTEGEEHGWSLQIEQGQALEPAKASTRPQGTTLIVQNLFHNTPVRKKFLASPATENLKVTEVVTRLALAHPDIAFQLSNDGRELLSLQSGNLSQRITQIFGSRTAKKMVAISCQESDCEVYGFVGNEESGQNRRLKQYLYLDKRPVENFQMSKALERSWQAFFPAKHPPAVLFMSMPRDEYDINVHPTKKEIRFSKPEEAFSIIHRLLRRAMDQIFRIQSTQMDHPEESYPLSQDFRNFEALALMEAPPQKVEKLDLFDISANQVHFGQNLHPSAPAVPEEPAPTRAETGMRLFQWAKSFVVAETDSGLLIVDQYNAHCRILFDKALNNLENAKCMSSQQLLFPEVIEFSPEESLILEEHADLFFLLAFDLEPFGKQAFRLRGIPSELSPSRAKDSLQNLITEMIGGKSRGTAIKEKLASAFASATALRRGQILNTEEMNALILELFSSPNPYVCPKGRSIFHRISLEDMERKFN